MESFYENFAVNTLRLKRKKSFTFRIACNEPREEAKRHKLRWKLRGEHFEEFIKLNFPSPPICHRLSAIRAKYDSKNLLDVRLPQKQTQLQQTVFICSLA